MKHINKVSRWGDSLDFDIYNIYNWQGTSIRNLGGTFAKQLRRQEKQQKIKQRIWICWEVKLENSD